MGYIGEHLLPGQLGHFFIVLSLVASMIAAFAYFKSAKTEIESEKISWKNFLAFKYTGKLCA